MIIFVHNYISIYIENKKYDNFIFYRSRIGEASSNFNKDDIKHVPFDKISQIGTYRFSIPGQPCLYLGSSSYNCWIEMGMPQDNSFNVGCILLKKDYTILNLGVNTNLLVQPNGIVNKEADQEALFKLFLLMIITSYKIRETRVFKSEYIISQLITLACKLNEIDGVSYSSKRLVSDAFGRDFCVNMALFVPYERGKKYSVMMDTEMYIGKPVNYSMFKNLNCVDTMMNRLPYENSPFIKNIGDFEHQHAYRETKFYDFDKYLYDFTVKSSLKIK